MAAKGALLELLENRSLTKDEKRKQVLACSTKHKMGVDSLLKFARDSMEVEEDELGALGTTVEAVTNSLVDVALLEEDSRDTVCVPRSLLVNLSEKIDSLTMALNKQTEMIADVEVRLMKELKTRESKIVDLIESSKVEPCSCSQSNGADTTNSKRIRKVKKTKEQKGKEIVKPNTSGWAEVVAESQGVSSSPSEDDHDDEVIDLLRNESSVT